MQGHLRLIASRVFVFGVMFCAMDTQANLTAKGYARYSDLSEDLFLTSLYDTPNFGDSSNGQLGERIRRLEFKFLGSQLSFRRFKQLLLQSSTINNPPQLMQSNASVIEEFVKKTKLKGSFQRGDHLVFESDANGLTTRFNSVELSVVKSLDLFDILLNSWVGKIPPSREFKEALLGETRDMEIERVFNKLTYSDARRQQIFLSVTQENRAEEQEDSKSPQVTIPDDKAAAKKKNSAVIKKVTQPKVSVPVLVKKPAPGNAPIVVKKAIQKPPVKKTPVVKKIAAASKEKPKKLEQRNTNVTKKLASVKDAPKSIFGGADTEEARNSRNKYSRDLYVHASKNISYPRRSRQLKHTGKVLAQVTIDREGRLLNIELETKTRHDSLNNAVEKALKKSQPYPGVPDIIKGDSFTFQVPVTFSL